MSLMTREDMLRELELLPVWQLKMQLPTIQDVALAIAEVEAPTQPVLPAVSTLPTLAPGVATAIIETSITEAPLIETSDTQAQAAPISDKSVADAMDSNQLVPNEAISEEPVSVELLSPIIEAMPQLDEPVQAPAAVAAPALRLLPFRLLVSEDTSFAFVLDDNALNGDAQDVETLLSNMLRAMNIKCNIDLSAANTDTLAEHPVKFIIVMGESAAHSLLGQNRTIEEWRSLQSDTLAQYQDLPVLVTYHPSFLLNNTAYKANAWLDLCAAKATLHRLHNR